MPLASCNIWHKINSTEQSNDPISESVLNSIREHLEAEKLLRDEGNKASVGPKPVINYTPMIEEFIKLIADKMGPQRAALKAFVGIALPKLRSASDFSDKIEFAKLMAKDHNQFKDLAAAFANGKKATLLKAFRLAHAAGDRYAMQLICPGYGTFQHGANQGHRNRELCETLEGRVDPPPRQGVPSPLKRVREEDVLDLLREDPRPRIAARFLTEEELLEQGRISELSSLMEPPPYEEAPIAWGKMEDSEWEEMDLDLRF